ncbi:hypothetical protein [Paracoccus sp. SSK6]|uniref:hypothetical protein n=1 Tax=Paracoccus sp. SSK6 TaxID=3143131 RepID=UPI00321C0AAD
MNNSTVENVAIAFTSILVTTVAALTLLPSEKLLLKPLFNDKINHMLAWGALTVPIASARPSAIRWLFPAAVGAGAAVELIQPSVDREREAGDLLADTFGAALGCLAGWLVHRACSHQASL